ncbi:ATP synhtase epsilon chain [Dinoroseobacter shibae DFL 12 = DSM 16493]|jgi:F-type H+-transporting ATPase subunit epsilon|uniref:ATP synthase epsilon chain n=1 Tax=Dinoroseobacter shibae (strain DSM 16493 / NCIMB 14021 / DFL 12) TaxID=398580 RepID=A8LJR3_DINSH|nr:MULTISPECIES: F0F1 ATP synthase subunit epsilon [Dinoroseobacter]ABV94666.1 ATP synhtase epsilon chain [Dinoroseobacter shibae DFL 12 = DSM 16493]MDD9716891.1 F0F1 ATP synthase subunit epsilon [Dinoroseobacter sp. PD6]URF46089.1 F0F1 ATP synthase subunit epsilon [Dinoroseobacter shibae]URF50396.1 F0F1 ATP synthase subunit epsilon [Dinoroseobacter shibae]
MANTLQFDLVSPERSLASLEVTEVQIPAADGDMTAMADHAPTITTLRPGILTAVGPSGRESFAVTGGFAEISAEGTTVLAERAYPAGADARAALEEHLEAARAKASEAQGEHKDVAEKLVDDMVKLLADMV